MVRGRRRLLGLLVASGLILGGSEAADVPRPEDDATYRPTVMVRRGKSLGTGTIIASAEDETLVLTASHVVESAGPIAVEVYRYNFGVEKFARVGGFPRKLEASLIARDVDADLAILRVQGQLAFPYFARVSRGEAAPPLGTKVTTIGFDRGAKLIGFSTRVRSVDRVDLGKGGGPRAFVVTEDPPEVGRSGGGLFREDGSLVGVCVGRVELEKGKVYGLFSSLGNIKALIGTDREIAASMTRAGLRTRSPAR